MQIEAGKYYRTRKGETIGPMRAHDDEHWQYGNDHEGRLWEHDGRRYRGEYPADDAIEELRGSPIRTVTRKEIVPGQYGVVGVGVAEHKHVAIGFTGAMEQYVSLNATDLRDAARIFNEIADALDA